MSNPACLLAVNDDLAQVLSPLPAELQSMVLGYALPNGKKFGPVNSPVLVDNFDGHNRYRGHCYQQGEDAIIEAIYCKEGSEASTCLTKTVNEIMWRQNTFGADIESIVECAPADFNAFAADFGEFITSTSVELDYKVYGSAMSHGMAVIKWGQRVGKLASLQMLVVDIVGTTNLPTIFQVLGVSLQEHPRMQRITVSLWGSTKQRVDQRSKWTDGQKLLSWGWDIGGTNWQFTNISNSSIVGWRR